ncbi:MAG: hypothetical protein Q8P07_03475 [bacterium]|nr:hypothetical protein [bacterium]
MTIFKRLVLILIAVSGLAYGAKSIFAAESLSVLYVPIIGITSVPDPLALPAGPGKVTYRYAVKNFVEEIPLTNIEVTDDRCGAVKFTEGDDNGDARLDYSETWRYTCDTILSNTTESTATAKGTANNITAVHRAFSTVIVGSNQTHPLVSIINITKVAYPLSLPKEGGDITFTYRVNNPGQVSLRDVVVTDDKCSAMSGKLGDINGNDQLDINEVWIYTCKTNLKQTTTNTVSVTSTANGFKAVGYATITVIVAESEAGFPAVPILPETGGIGENSKIIIWMGLVGILAVLAALFVVKRVKHNE